MKPIDIELDAQSELKEAVAYINERRPGKGSELLDAVEKAFEIIPVIPQGFARFRRSRFRMFVMNRFPYAIVYEELPNAISVVAFAHTHRRPGYWLGRTRKKKPRANE